jgi:hypothetical protein
MMTLTLELRKILQSEWVHRLPNFGGIIVSEDEDYERLYYVTLREVPK